MHRTTERATTAECRHSQLPGQPSPEPLPPSPLPTPVPPPTNPIPDPIPGPQR